MNLSIELISKYRSQIMGFAILWVMMSHVPIGKDILVFAQYIGFGGVEMFMIVSGYGLFYAMKKTKSLIQYYRRRLVRIIPMWFLCSLLLYFFCNSEPLISWAFIRRIGQCWWFIPFILLVYGISPLVYKAIISKSTLPIIGIITATVLCQIIYKESGFSNIMINLSFARFFDFIIGMYMAKALTEGKQLKIFWLIITGISGFVLVYLLSHDIIFRGFWHIHYDLRLYPMVLTGPMMCYFVVWISSMTKYISIPLKFLGEFSLELYLMHVLIWWIVRDQNLLSWYLFYPVSISASYLLHLINKEIARVLS